jgi:ABC-2 type transport system ATP-binding protein
MSAGTVKWQGSMADLAARQQARVQVLTTAPALAAQVLAERGLDDVRVADGEVSAVLGTAVAEHLVAALVAAGVGVRGFQVERPRLEEMFVELTGEGFDVSG